MVTPSGFHTGARSWSHAGRNRFYTSFDFQHTPSAHAAYPWAAREEQIERQIAERTRDLERVIAQLRARQEQLEAELNHDNLTGLANRKLLNDRFECALHRARRSGKGFALLMIDLNGFKAVNDTHGHAAGDRVLVTVAQRLQATLRTCDTAARMGGDEFVVLVEAIHTAQEVSDIERKLVHALEQPMCLDGNVMVTVGASIGQALYPDDGLDFNQMLYVADQAMYECKASGFISLEKIMSGGKDMTRSDRQPSFAGMQGLVADGTFGQRTLPLVDGKDVSPKEWAVMINRHPSIVHKVLQVINSSYSHLPTPIASVQQAVVYLGFNTVRNLAGTVSPTCTA